MTQEGDLRQSFQSLEVNEAFTEAALVFTDGGRLLFRHRVGERWVKAVDEHGMEDAAGLAARVLATIALFRLNGKHLDIQFQDGSRWETRFGR